MQGDHVKSAARVLEILEFFADHRRPARMSVLIRALGYPPSSMTGLLRTLVARGYMDIDPDTHEYMPTARLMQLTRWLGTGGYEETVVLDAMHRLRDRVDEPVVLGAPVGLHIEYVMSLHRSDGVNSHIRPGDRRLMIQNGIGWLLLSRMPRSDALRVHEGTVAAGLLQADDFDRASYEQTLDRHEDTDVSVLHARDLIAPTAHWNASMVAVLIPVPDGHARPLGVGVHGPTARIIDKTPVLIDALRGLVRDLHAQIHGSASHM
ncbi:IclR helix-turn-helix domain protein [Roseivivax jejudonensis]|uniref:IclR helix-turn-helix domain protein n=1 Tax=Roseivivax jejudonensis TaxID=1529041 RepID=A0A1X6ZZR2_9RHOB|nr:helix-turn-helix domain-containing protein [Roseivivax jejudonensis]SLN66018.1 IclR helix-turn-helix domain protein [Roseivivax jejudonensis]